LFTAFTGIGLGIAVMSRTPALRIAAPIGGYLCAVAAHALWNGSTVFGFGSFVLAYLVLMVPAFVGMICLAVWARTKERHMLTLALDD
ncbi:PrsW family glutamic-type intramembrane protease, partial [Nocardioides antri]